MIIKLKKHLKPITELYCKILRNENEQLKTKDKPNNEDFFASNF